MSVWEAIKNMFVVALGIFGVTWAGKIIKPDESDERISQRAVTRAVSAELAKALAQLDHSKREVERLRTENAQLRSVGVYR